MHLSMHNTNSLVNVCLLTSISMISFLFIYLGFNVTLNTVKVLSRWVNYGQRKPVNTVDEGSVMQTADHG